MTFSRFQFERAVMASDLAAGPRHVLHVLATRTDAKSGQIPVTYTPSLTNLADATGLDRRTIERHLTTLEGAGWVIRRRPTVEAQRKGARTQYQLHIAGASGGGTPLASESARDASPLPLGARRPEARGTTPLNTYDAYKSFPGRDRHEVACEIARGMTKQGIETTVGHAMRVMDQVLERADAPVANPVGYVLAAVKRDPQPYRPTIGPPPVRDVLAQLRGHVA